MGQKNDTGTDTIRKINLILRKHHSSDQGLQESTHSENDSIILESAGVHNWIFDYIKYNILNLINSKKIHKINTELPIFNPIALNTTRKNLFYAERVHIIKRTNFNCIFMIL
jgi:hypothetical protein